MKTTFSLLVCAGALAAAAPLNVAETYSGTAQKLIAAALAENPTSEADEYSRIRGEIVASGLPMLSDDEVRAEIQERRGIRDDSES